MERKSLKKRINFLKLFEKDSNKKRHLQHCNDDCVEYICEACYNILRGKINLSNSYRKKLKKHKKLIRELANPKPGTSLKRNLLLKTQVGKGLFPVIIKAVLPFLINLLKKKKNVIKYRN